MTIHEDYARLGIVAPKKLLDREIQLCEAKDQDIQILLNANESLLRKVEQQKQLTKRAIDLNVMNCQYIAVISAMAFGIVCSFFTIIYRVQNDTQISDMQAEITRLQQSNLARENAALKKQIDSQKCLFNVCVK